MQICCGVCTVLHSSSYSCLRRFSNLIGLDFNISINAAISMLKLQVDIELYRHVYVE